MPVEGVDEEAGTRRLRHAPQLDGVRGVAVVLVIAYHASLTFFPKHFDTAIPGGFLGVDIFFVLSGFLITSLLFQEHRQTGRVALGQFYRRRALRLLPALVVLLIAHVMYAYATNLPLRTEAGTVVAALFYVSNWVIATGTHFDTDLKHLWSLSIEEQFYAVWPIVAILLLRRRRVWRDAAVVITIAILAAMVSRAVSWHDGTTFFNVDHIYMRTDTRADSLLVGALAAVLWSHRKIGGRVFAVAAYPALLVVGYCVAKVPVWRGFYFKGGFTLVALAVAVIIVGVVESGGVLARVLAWRPLATLGRVSYGLYLWHLPVFAAVARYTTGSSGTARLAGALALTAVATSLSWFFIETPFLALKRRPPAATSGTTVAPA